jgi:outer membrane receptor protein involved in Fe transport
MKAQSVQTLLRAGVAGVVLLASMLTLMAQGTSNGTLVGLVTDTSGGVLPSVKVVATNVATNIEYPTVTNSTGNYTIPSLPIGTYQVTAELTGFKRMVYDSVLLEVNQTRRLDMTMQVGAVTTSTTVTAQVPLVNTENAALGEVIGKQEIVDLPLNGRDYAQLAWLTPGVVPGARGFSGTQDTSGISSLNFYAGGRNANNSFLVDGVESRGVQFGNIVLVPNLDSISEFKVQTNSFSAEFGAAGNGVINIATSSGTNKFHGTVYEFLRNDDLDARNFFDAQRPAFERNQFGSTLGGPLIHDKTFFHVDYEGMRQRQANTYLASVPTALERVGNFTEFTNPDGSFIPVINILTGAPFPGNIIPPQLIDPIGQKIANLYPLPNLPGTSSNYLANPVIPSTNDEFSGRIDHEFSTKDRIFARYIFQDYYLLLLWPPLLPDVRSGRSQNQVLGWTHGFSPAVLNDLHLGYMRDVYRGVQQDEGKVGHLGGLAIAGIDTPPAMDAYPEFAISGENAVGNGTSHFQRYENIYSVADSLTWIHGAHSFKAGFLVAVKHENNILRSVGSRGYIIFLPLFGGNFIGNAMPEVLTGHPVYALRSLGDTRADGRATHSGYYVQDDWKVTPRLTLNLGLRYEYFQPWVDDNLGAPATFTTGVGSKAGAFPNGTIVVAGTPQAAAAGFTGRANRALYFPDRRDWAPRVGLAWRPFGNDSTVVRAGYGIFYSPVVYDAPYLMNLMPPHFGVVSSVGLLSIANPFQPFNGDYNQLNGYTLASSFVTGYVQQSSLSIERRLSNSTALEVSYVGNKGTHLDGGVRLFNQAPPVPPSPPPPPAISRRPYPGFGTDEMYDSSVSSNYHALQVRLEHRFSQGFSFTGAYTFSKAIDDGAGEGDTFAGGDVYYWQNAAHPSERGLSLFDVRQRLVFSWIYALPFGKGKAYLSKGGITDAVLGGWQISGIASFQSGFPITPITGEAISGADPGSIVATDRPNRIKDGNLPSSQRKPERWFDTSAFVPNNPGEWGNSGRGILTGPGLKDWDIALFKGFQLREQLRLQFRCETFNTFNNVNFGFPDLTLIDPTFGKVTSAGNARQIQFGLKLIF